MFEFPEINHAQWFPVSHWEKVGFNTGRGADAKSRFEGCSLIVEQIRKFADWRIFFFLRMKQQIQVMRVLVHGTHRVDVALDECLAGWGWVCNFLVLHLFCLHPFRSNRLQKMEFTHFLVGAFGTTVSSVTDDHQFRKPFVVWLQ